MSRPVLLIAGGGRGIGAATCRLAGSRGYDVAVNYKSNAKTAASVVEAVKAAGGNAVAIQGDMAIEADVERVFDAAVAQLGPLTHAKGKLAHPKGFITADLRVENGALKGSIELPEGVSGTLKHGRYTIELVPGRQEI